jgi:hypothetical protein
MDHQDYDRARAHVRSLRSFYLHAAVYLIVNFALLALNLIRNPDHLWFYWVALGWGIGLAAHAYLVFGSHRLLGADWQERKIQEELDREGKR